MKRVRVRRLERRDQGLKEGRRGEDAKATPSGESRPEAFRSPPFAAVGGKGPGGPGPGPGPVAPLVPLDPSL